MQPMIYIYGEGPFDNYRAALFAAGAAVATPDDGISPDGCRGLLLPGGGDIHGQLPPTEQAIIRSFAESGRPILGICRGMQALNVYFGGTLFDCIPGHQAPDTDLVHPTAATGLLSALLGPTPTVNSNHHQAVDRLGHDLVICQRTTDGIAETITHTSLPILGLHWHPERQSFSRLRPDAADASPIFHHFIQQARAIRCNTSGN